MEIFLNVQNRTAEAEMPESYKKISLKVSRLNCMDVLLEVVDSAGLAKGKPLQKCLPEIKNRNVAKLRFIMKNNSTRPITIKIDF